MVEVVVGEEGDGEDEGSIETMLSTHTKAQALHGVRMEATWWLVRVRVIWEGHCTIKFSLHDKCETCNLFRILNHVSIQPRLIVFPLPFGFASTYSSHSLAFMVA